MIISFNNGEENVISQIMGLLTNESFEVIEQKENPSFTSSNMKLYSREHRIEIDNKILVLGRKQFALLSLLARNPNRIFTKEDLYSYVWSDLVPINVEETVRYHISDIRKKLNQLSKDSFIETIWGIGYRFREKV